MPIVGRSVVGRVVPCLWALLSVRNLQAQEMRLHPDSVEGCYERTRYSLRDRALTDSIRLTQGFLVDEDGNRHRTGSGVVQYLGARYSGHWSWFIREDTLVMNWQDVLRAETTTLTGTPGALHGSRKYFDDSFRRRTPDSVSVLRIACPG